MSDSNELTKEEKILLLRFLSEDNNVNSYDAYYFDVQLTPELKSLLDRGWLETTPSTSYSYEEEIKNPMHFPVRASKKAKIHFANKGINDAQEFLDEKARIDLEQDRRLDRARSKAEREQRSYQLRLARAQNPSRFSFLGQAIIALVSIAPLILSKAINITLPKPEYIVVAAVAGVGLGWLAHTVLTRSR